MFKNKNHLWIIIISSLLIAVLANINLVIQIYTLAQAEALSMIKREELTFIFRLGVKNILSELIMLLFIIFFNYSWKDRILPKDLSPGKRIAAIVFLNGILLLILIYTDITLEKYLSPVSQGLKPFSLGNYFLKHISVLLLAFAFPYLLLRMRGIELAERTLNQIKEEKAKAELSALKEQISPHFFFNTLSTLSTIVRNESKEAGLSFIQDMSDTYRYTLRSAKDDLVNLGEEVHFIKAYIYLLEKRFGEKLHVELNIAETFFSDQIPPMSLQLLIENAIQHNIITQAMPLYLKLSVQDKWICVENNLQEKEQVESFGIGLNNLNNRYKLLTGYEIIIERDTEMFRVKLPRV